MAASTSFFEKFNAIHGQLDWYVNREKLLVAVSGGMDSMTLLFVLHELGSPVEAFHINYELRGEESEKDEELVKEFSKSKNITLHLRRPEFFKEELKGQSGIQEFARKERYKHFEIICKERGIERICTAHHLDDQAETMIHRFIRGSGWKGFLGIVNENKNVLRPFLLFTRHEIEKLADEKNIPFRTDSTNLTDKYTRNYIRHHILPPIEYLVPEWKNHLPERISVLRDQWSFFQYSVFSFWKPRIEYDHDYIQINCFNLTNIPGCNSLLFELMENLHLNTGPLKDIIADLNLNKSGTIYPNGDDYILLYRNKLIVKRFPGENSSIELPVHFIPTKLKNNKLVVPGGVIYLSESQTSRQQDCLPLDKKMADTSLTIRKWKHGDVFKPAGMKGRSKKLSDFFTDLLIHRFKKDNLIVLSNLDEILWIPGYRRGHTKDPADQPCTFLVYEREIKPTPPLEIFGEMI